MVMHEIDILNLNFSLDHEGNVDGINYSVPQRDSRFSISIDKVDEWYKAKAKFVELIHDEAVTFKTKPGKYKVVCHYRWWTLTTLTTYTSECPL